MYSVDYVSPGLALLYNTKKGRTFSFRSGGEKALALFEAQNRSCLGHNLRSHLGKFLDES